MILSNEIVRFARWTAGISRKFLRLKPTATFGVVLAIAIRGVLQLLTFMLPLKVILLAASVDIPSYFPFIELADKDIWIGFLAVGALGVYASVQLLAPAIDHWSLRAGTDLLRQANDLPVNAHDAKQVQRAFIDFTGVLASLLFLTVTVLVLSRVNPVLLLWLTLALVVLYLVSSWVLKGCSLPAPPLKARVIQGYRAYMDFWGALTFFGAFGVILWPFLGSGNSNGGNVFFALVSFILVRRMISEIVSVVAKGVSLVQQRATIDALLYKSHVVISSRADSRVQLFRELFARQSRDRLLTDALSPFLADSGPLISLSSKWLDPSPPQVKHFLVEVNTGVDSSIHRFDVRVYWTDTQFQAEHAAFLFRYIAPAQLYAPDFVTKTVHHGYLIAIHSVSDGQVVAARDWKELRLSLVQHLLAIVPPDVLVRSYRSTHPMLGERLTERFCRRLEAAVDSDLDSRVLDAWCKELPRIVKFLQRQPMALINPDLTTSNVVQTSAQERFVLYWGRWRLEPFGAAVLSMALTGQVEKMVQELRLKRKDLLEHDWANDLEIAFLCQQIEQAITGERAKQALSLMERTLEVFNEHNHKKIITTQTQPATLETTPR